jgi:hypothetical protein
MHRTATEVLTLKLRSILSILEENTDQQQLQAAGSCTTVLSMLLKSHCVY